MYRFGSHVSCAGGLGQAITRARELGCQCLQIFVSSPRAWPTTARLIPLTKRPAGKSQRTPAEASDPPPAMFRQQLTEAHLEAPIAHAAYLINLASPNETLWHQSIDALTVEWRRADQLQLDGIVLHPGSHTTTTVESGLANVVRGIRIALERVQPQRCPLLLENTAGQGSALGWQIEQLGWLVNELRGCPIGICWDTCHALAAGYDFRTPAGLDALIAQLAQHAVLDQIRAIHVNDSVKDCGSRVDRHEHIGLGCIGAAGWKLFLKSDHFRHLPMYLETEKGVDEQGVDWDVRNLATLRSYVA